MATILVVDDDPDFRAIAGTVLEGAGYQVRTAADGGPALDEMRARPPDLVILDVMMSTVLEGVYVSDSMAADARLKRVPVIMVSSIAGSSHADLFPTDAYLAVDAFMSKPVEPRALLDQVAALIAARRKGEAASGAAARPGAR